MIGPTDLHRHQKYLIVGLSSRSSWTYGAGMKSSDSGGHDSPAWGSSLAALRGDCARMVPHWVSPGGTAPCPAPPAHIRGVVVPPSAARLLDAMSDYGD